jgi:aldose 1-epimerase
MIAPSGEQITIAAGDQQAVVVEVGGGLRSYSAGGRELVDGHGADEMCSSGRGQVLILWPNRVQDGSYELHGRRHQLPPNEPERRNAIHGLVRWAAWTAAEHEPNRAVMEYVLHPQPGYPFSLKISVEYALSDRGLQVRTTAANLGNESPYGSGAHPYLTLGTNNDRSFDFTPACANCPKIRRAWPANWHGSCGGYGIRFSSIKADRPDSARPCIHRP